MTVTRTKARTEKRELGSLRLFREDLEDMAEALAELGPLRIECDDYVGDAKEDFADLPEKLTFLTISSQDGHRSIELSLAPRVNLVTITEANTQCRGIFGHIQEICNRPGRRLTSMPDLTIMAISILCIIGPLFMISAFGVSSVILLISGIVNIFLMMAYVLFATFSGKRKFGVGVRLINAYRVDRPSFWRRTRDDWAVESIIGLVFLVLGFVLGKMAS